MPSPFADLPLREAATRLFTALGFRHAQPLPHDAERLFNAETYGESCAFLAIKLACAHERHELADMTRRLSRVHAMHVCVLFGHGERISLAFASPHSSIDALEKVTLIHDISIVRPHAGHLASLKSLSRVEPSADALGKRFYREIADWYFHALENFEFPAKARILGDKEKASSLVRWLTRAIFQEFLKQKDFACVEENDALLRILRSYKFTAIENTPVEEEIALDPEVLGTVFENLLASFNDETRATARKHSGSFYTPRAIVDYMVGASLKHHLAEALRAKGAYEAHIDAALDTLLRHGEREHSFSPDETAILLDAIRSCRIFDPACGSGAFPMGALHKLVHIMRKLDPHGSNDDARKRYVIEHCLHGVDIQPIAIEITRLRFTLSLLCDQRTPALPVFDANFVVANALTDSNVGAGFDIVIGNPPYFKENDDRTRFDGLRDRACYQGKMDLWYLFADVGLDRLKPNGVLAFIATSNWTTSAGASKIRNKIVKDATLIELIDFNDHMIFESARVQTMIMLLSKRASPSSYRASIARARDGFCAHDMIALNASSNLHRFVVDIDRTKLIDKPLVFNAEDHAAILNLIDSAGDFSLRKEEIAQGIVPNPDRVNARNIAAIGADAAKARGIVAGDGVFVLDEAETRVIDEREHVHLKPLYEPVHIDRYFKRPTDLRIIYAKKGGFYAEHAPSVVAHLRKFREIMELRRENALGRIAFHHLHWPREEACFVAGQKILAPRKCLSPVFLYTEDEAYVMLSMNVIRTRRIDMRYLSAVLNSSTIRFWLRHRGSRQGLNYQIDAAPLQLIPIAQGTARQRDTISTLVRLVQQQYLLDELAPSDASSLLEALIDACVMECYFRDHMTERGLLVTDDVAAWLSADQNSDVSPLRDRLQRLRDASPDLLALIRDM